MYAVLNRHSITRNDVWTSAWKTRSGISIWRMLTRRWRAFQPSPGCHANATSIMRWQENRDEIAEKEDKDMFLNDLATVP